MSSPEDNPDLSGIEAYLAEMASDMEEPEEEPDPREAEYEHAKQMSEQQTIEVFKRHGFALEVPEGETIEAATWPYYRESDRLTTEFREYCARFQLLEPKNDAEAAKWDAEMDEKHAEFLAKHAALMRESEPLYLADRLASYVAFRITEGHGDVDDGAETIAKILASEYLDDDQRQRLLRAAHELLGDEEYAAAMEVVQREGLDAQEAAEKALGVAQGAQASEELQDIMFALSNVLGARNVEHDEWLSLAQDFQKLCNDTKRLVRIQKPGDQLTVQLQNRVQRDLKGLREKASRVGVNKWGFERLLLDRGITSFREQEED